MDSRRVKTIESGGIRGCDAGAMCPGGHGRPRPQAQGPRADIQDRDGAGPLLRASRPSSPFVQLAHADGGYAGHRVASASPIRIEVIRKVYNQIGFAVIARRWVVEGVFAWSNRNRRLARDVEATIASAETFLYAASAILLSRRLAR